MPDVGKNLPPAGTPGISPPTPLSLLDRLRANEPDAWRRLLDLYQPLVAFWCARCGLAPEDVADVTQEVFAGAADGISRFRHDQPGDTFCGWLRGITRNQVLLFHRRNQGKPTADGGSSAQWKLQQIEAPTVGADDEESLEISKVYKRALEQVRVDFEERTWLAFWLTVIEGRAPATITAELGMTVAGIRQAKSRVLRRVKLEVGDIVD
jgi:RNA polymerase sigma-70 factor (ECF subfamily)